MPADEIDLNRLRDQAGSAKRSFRKAAASSSVALGGGSAGGIALLVGAAAAGALTAGIGFVVIVCAGWATGAGIAAVENYRQKNKYEKAQQELLMNGRENTPYNEHSASRLAKGPEIKPTTTIEDQKGDKRVAKAFEEIKKRKDAAGQGESPKAFKKRVQADFKTLQGVYNKGDADRPHLIEAMRNCAHVLARLDTSPQQNNPQKQTAKSMKDHYATANTHLSQAAKAQVGANEDYKKEQKSHGHNLPHKAKEKPGKGNNTTHVTYSSGVTGSMAPGAIGIHNRVDLNLGNRNQENSFTVHHATYHNRVQQSHDWRTYHTPTHPAHTVPQTAYPHHETAPQRDGMEHGGFSSGNSMLQPYGMGYAAGQQNFATPQGGFRVPAGAQVTGVGSGNIHTGSTNSGQTTTVTRMNTLINPWPVAEEASRHTSLTPPSGGPNNSVRARPVGRGGPGGT